MPTSRVSVAGYRNSESFIVLSELYFEIFQLRSLSLNKNLYMHFNINTIPLYKDHKVKQFIYTRAPIWYSNISKIKCVNN